MTRRKGFRSNYSCSAEKLDTASCSDMAYSKREKVKHGSPLHICDLIPRSYDNMCRLDSMVQKFSVLVHTQIWIDSR